MGHGQLTLRHKVVWAAGVLAGFMTLGRDQIALLCIFVLAAYAIWHVWDGRGMRRRLLRSLGPLSMGFIGGVLTKASPKPPDE